MDQDPSLPTEQLSLDAVIVHPEVRPRAGAPCLEHARELEGHYRRRKKLPPGRVCRLPDGTNVLTRGEHRLIAAKAAGLTHLVFEVKAVETLGEAEWDAAGSNLDHGLKRTREDREKAVLKAKHGRPWVSAEQIAEHVQVDPDTVRAVLARAAAVAAAGGETLSGVPVKPPAPPESGEDENGKGEANSRSRREERASTVACLLKKDPRESNEKVASVVGDGCTAKEVQAVRLTLQREGLIPGGERDDDEPTTGKGKGKGKKGKAEEPAVLRDALGRAVPAHLADVWGDPTLPELVAKGKALKAAEEAYRREVEAFARQKGRFYQFALAAEAALAVNESVNSTEVAVARLEAGLPYVVHDECGGAGCPGCRTGGYLPQWRHEGRAAYGEE